MTSVMDVLGASGEALREGAEVRILLVKPQPRLATVKGLQRFLRLEPLELGYLAAAVPGHHVSVLDLRLSAFPWRALCAALRRTKPDLVGFTCYTHEASRVKELAGLAKRECPGAFVVVGGHHATIAPEDLNVPAIDFVVRGEGCGPFSALVKALERRASPEGIPALLLTGDRFDPAAASGFPEPYDPASLPLPRRDLWDPRSYYAVWLSETPGRDQPLFPAVALARTSYGCSMRCSFCVVPMLSAGRHRPRPVEAVVEEFQSLSAGYVYFCDDETFLDRRFAFELAEGLARRGVKKRYFAWTRASSVLGSPELFRRWREVGLDAVFIGFEFSSDAQLKGVAKGATVAANERALETLRAMGVAVHAAFMVRPEDTAEDFRKLRDYMRALPPAECSVTVCTPSPGTPEYAAQRPRMWVENPHDFYDAMHPLTPTTVPLREFSRLYASVAVDGVEQSPMRTRPFHLRDVTRVLLAQSAYRSGFRKLYRDYPRRLWQ